ncbi:LamG-like jellyroll fold domain-containing protein [Micromonospora robiginosa]|uniref:LamG-like jellyroll fold domain-containing protein n=1 Tax=Micromonospora robiginosa TaxID=2749844 RepID=A0A7L6B031_9ACTN|nr:LamG-like jellyroll fold domain-containing protein [Micromonospora ferruginea]QLQ35328.1 LamG-like jellyroll fold domain-containing protein [Micromonospora ferruginea]
MALTVAVPPGAVPVDGDFPLSWLWSWLPQRAAWSAPGPDGPQQRAAGGADGRSHQASAAQTTANGGRGRAPGHSPQAAPADKRVPPKVAKATTPSIPGRTGFDPRRSQRATDKTEARADVYENPDGSVTRQVHELPVNYRRADGSWQPIDRTLVRSGGRLKQKASPLPADLAATAADPRLATLGLGEERSLSYGLQGAAPVAAEISGASALYRAALPETDLRLTVRSGGVKEELILHSVTAGNSWVFPLRAKGVTPTVEQDGSVALRNRSGEVVGQIPVGFMHDSYMAPGSGEFTNSHAVAYDLTTTESGQPALRMTADAEWLRDPARVFPVTVDPSVTAGYDTTDDTYVQYGDDTNHSGDDNLAVGTWDSGTHRSISLLAFSNYGSAFNYKKLSSVKLKLYLTWQYNCTAQEFWVQPLTTSWSASTARYKGLPYAGPGLGSELVRASPNSAKACGNKVGDRSVGEWVTVNLPIATFQDWANGGANYGLALNTSQTNNPQFKRFTSRNGPNAVFTPYLEMTYTDNVAPQVNSQYPPHGHQVSTLTPELLANASDPDLFPSALSFDFLVYDRTATKIAESGWQPYMTWAVPAGKLKWSEAYTWTVIVKDGNQASTSQKLQSFSTGAQQPLLTGELTQNGERRFDPGKGNYTFSATDAAVPTAGPPLSIVRSYDSRSARRGAFGEGWSSLLDMRVVDPWSSIKSPPPHVLVTYPTGQVVSFGRNPDGSFVPPSGRFATFTEQPGGYELVDKDGTTYTFRGGISVPGQYDISAITDSNGRTLTFHYTFDSVVGRATTITTSSGRSLRLRWSTGAAQRVLSVTTDAATPGDDTTSSTWNYAYTDGLLTQVCPPTSTTRCTTYTYATNNRYPAAALDARPRDFWRLGESSGTTAANGVPASTGIRNGTYSGVTLGRPGALPGSSATAAGFNGSSSYVSLPVQDVDPAGYKSVSLWFQMTAGSTAGGTLFAYQTVPITSAAAQNWTPALYVGTDGKLRGEFWTGAVEPMVSGSVVNDGKWHHATLVGDKTSQTLYLDGAPQATLAKPLVQTPTLAKYVYVGAGETSSWPSRPTNSKGFFPGSIGEVAYFDRALSRFDVNDLDSANIAARPVESVVRPSGNVEATVTYDPAASRVTQVVDENGGVWKVGAGSVTGSYAVHSGAVLGANPADYWRFAESGTTEAVNEVNGGTATYNAVTLGTPGGPFDDPARGDDDTTVATFNGTSSFVELPVEDVPGVGPQSVALWFKTPAGYTGGGVLFGSQVNDVDGAASQTGGYSPNLYVGTDGKLRGKFWNGANTPITSTALVNDGKWHHAVLSAKSTSQTLYLDGVPVSTMAGNLASYGALKAYVGAGQAATWPAAPTNTRGYYKGDIAEVSYYRAELTAADAAAQFAARSKSSGVLVKTYEVTDPGNKRLRYVHDLADRKIEETDALGGSTRYGYDVNGFLRTTTDPNGNVTTTEHDPRGNVVSSTTCQDRSANKCSTNYYTYFVNSTTPAMWNNTSLLFSPGDFDGDGDTDLIYRNDTDTQLYLMRGNGEGGWLTSVPVQIGAPGWNTVDQMLSPGDFDGDGKPDIIYHLTGDANFYLLRGDGKGWWKSSESLKITSTFGATAQMVFSPGDFDGDGKRDILFRKSTDNNLYLVKGNGAGGWLTGTPVQVGTGWGSAELIFSPGDFDGDAKPDVLYRKSTDKGLYIVKGNGTGGWLTGTSVLVTAGWSGFDALLSPGDFTGDRKADVIRRGSTDRDLYLLRGNGTGGWATGSQEKLGAGGPDPRNDALLTVRDGRSSSATDNQFLTSYGYDRGGHRISVTDPLGRVTATSYTDGADPAQGGGVAPAGLASVVTSPGGARQRITYFSNGDIARIVDAVGKVTEYTYDGLGRVLTKTEKTETFPAGLVTRFEYDGLGRVVTRTDPAVTNRVTGAVHTAVTTSTYDDDGNMLSETVSDATGGDASRTESATYNSRGQQETSTDARSKTTRVEYDSFGRPVKEIAPDGGEVVTEYDANGQQVSTTLRGWTGNPGNPSPPRDLVLSSRAYDPAGRLASETDAMGWSTVYTYTDNGLTATVTRKDPSNGATFVAERTEYDGAGNPSTRTTNDGATTVVNTVDAANRVTRSLLDPNGLKRYTDYEYSADGQVAGRQLWTPEATWARYQTHYDAAGRKLAETVYLGGAPLGRWKFDGTTDAARTSDGTGNSSLTANGTVAWSADRDGAADLSGAGSLSTRSAMIDAARDFTVSAWASPADVTGTRKVLAGSGTAQDAFDLRLDGGRWKFVLRAVDDPDATTVAATSTSTPTAGAWTHLAGTYDVKTGTMRLYVNGVLEDTRTGARSFTTRAPFRIGAGSSAGVPADLWTGKIDDVHVYQRLLSDSDIARVTAGTAPAGNESVQRTSYTVDNGGLVRSVTDANGLTTDTEFDEAGRPTVTVQPAVNVETGGSSPVSARPISSAGYDTFGSVVETKDPNGNVTVQDYDAAGRVTATRMPSYTPPGGTPVEPVVRRSYDALGQLETETDALEKVTDYEYDQLGQLTAVTAPDGGVTRYTYDLAGDRLSTTDPTGGRTEATYDYMGRVLTSTDVVRQTGASYSSSYSYGPGGWLASQTSPDGVTGATTYNAAGEAITQTDGAGKTTQFGFDGIGRPNRTTLPDGTYTTATYDMASQPFTTTSWSATGSSLRTEKRYYDRGGRVVYQVDARETATRFGYDAAGRLSFQVEPISASDNITTFFGYDAAGNQTRMTDGRQNRFITTYNSWNLPESRIEPATSATPGAADRTFTVSYDASGRAVTQRSPGGVSVTNSYDEVGRLTQQVGAGAEATSPDRVFDYDRAGRLTSVSGTTGTNTFTYDDRGLLLSTEGPSGASSFAWSGDRKLARRTDAAGVTTFGYDSAGRPATASNPTTGVATSYTYNLLSQVQTIGYGSGGNVRTLSYDDLHRLTGDVLKTAGGQTVASVGYGYDANGNETSKTTTGFAGSSTNTYTYDLANRLTGWDNGSTPVVYAYDKSGNRVQAGSVTFSYDQRNQLTSSSNGTTYRYTPRGTLASATTAAGEMLTATDAFGQVRSQGLSGGGSQAYDYDGLGRLVRAGFQYTGTGNTLAADGVALYTRDMTDDLVGVRSAEENRYAWTDRHQDVVGQFGGTDPALSGSTAYDPLGRRLAGSGMLGNLGYQSEWTDSSNGRVNMWSRWYNPDTGQFDTRDSATLSPTPTSVTANRFAYADNNPLTVTDPTGHWPNWGNTFSSMKSGLSSAWNSTASSLSSAWHATTSTLSSAWNATTNWASQQWNRAKSWASQQWDRAKNWGSQQWNRAKNWATDTYHKAQKKVDDGRKWLAQKAAEAKRKAQQLASNIKQAGKNMVTKVMSNKLVAKTVNGIADAYKATEKWVQEHKADIAGFIVGAAVGIGCGALIGWTGVGAIACGALAGAAGSLVTGLMNGERGMDLLKTTALGALGGAVGGLGGIVGGRLAAAVGSRLSGFAGTLGGRVLGGAIGGGTADAMTQLATTGRINVTQVALATGVGALAGGLSKGRGSCHSFEPGTRVLMADGTTRPIRDVNIGDRVKATDPTTGKTVAKPVTALHLNRDRDLADVTVSIRPKGKAATQATLKTTQNHPFWSQSGRRWVTAGALAVGTALLSIGASSAAVADVRSHTGAQNMRDLTVADVHTYYVLAGTTPVLVHNCGTEPIKPTRTFRTESAIDNEPQGPLPRSAFNENGRNLADGDHHYVVMRDNSVRSMHSDDMFAIDETSGHTSLSGGEPVFMAGHFQASGGRISEFDNWSGHYSPNNAIPGYRPISDVARAALENNGFPGARSAAWDDITE